MANKRMFSNLIIDTDMFLDMPLSSQALYFHLNMRADDDGFISNAKKIQRMIGSNDDDFKLLLAKKFIIRFEGTGICVIRHWRIHNYIQKDRYTETIYREEKKKLIIDRNKSYQKISDTECTQPVNNLDTDCKQTVHKPVYKPVYKPCPTCVPRLDLDLDLDLDKNNTSTQLSTKSTTENNIDYKYILNSFKSICTLLPIPRKLNDSRKKAIRSILKSYSQDDVLDVFRKVENSNFLNGKSGKWQASFDWIFKPSNFIKILEGNYDNKGSFEENSNHQTIVKDANGNDVIIPF